MDRDYQLMVSGCLQKQLTVLRTVALDGIWRGGFDRGGADADLRGTILAGMDRGGCGWWLMWVWRIPQSLGWSEETRSPATRPVRKQWKMTYIGILEENAV